jgi:hypothetical protein
MDKISRIVAAAMFASSIAYITPALAVETTAEDFVVALSTDFSQGDFAAALAKVQELKSLGFTGIMFDSEQLISVDKLIELLTAVQNGELSGASVAASLLAYLQAADYTRFIMGGIITQTADLNGGVAPGSVFPAGSAG